VEDGEGADGTSEGAGRANEGWRSGGVTKSQRARCAGMGRTGIGLDKAERRELLQRIALWRWRHSHDSEPQRQSTTTRDSGGCASRCGVRLGARRFLQRAQPTAHTTTKDKARKPHLLACGGRYCGRPCSQLHGQRQQHDRHVRWRWCHIHLTSDSQSYL
jgi:hypothetical protein